MKLFRQIYRPNAGPASVHGLLAFSIEGHPLTGIGMFGLPSRPERPAKRKRLLEHLRAELARRSWRQPA
ncbi:MAG: hypothetical protein ABL998_03415 [Planctomycetota bacterium]